MFSLAGRLAVITGGGTGIGTGIALEMARAGAGLVLAGRRRAKLEETARLLHQEVSGVTVHCIECDVRSRDSCDHLIKEAFALGHVHALVNNAGIEGDVAPVQDCPDETWDDLFSTNVRSNFYLARASIPYFQERFAQHKKEDSWGKPLHTGAIIILSSIAGKAGLSGLAAYSASNFARIGFAKSLALELAPIKVTVNALCPGVVWTPMWDRIAGGMDGTSEKERTFAKTVEDWIPLHRPQTPQDMGHMAVFLATQPNVTAQDLYVDGGYTHF
eukprot:EG_transcript_13468